MRFGPFTRAALAALILTAGALHAQQPSTAPEVPLPLPPDGGPYKLHVFARLLQIPTVIRDRDKETPPNLTRDQVRITLDDGPQFSPTAIRLEGEDPISLAVLLDVTGSQTKTIDALVQSLPALVPTSLRPTEDSLALFATDCINLHTASASMIGPDSVSLRLSKLLHAEGLHGKKTRGACSGSLKLWDAAASAIYALARTPGRRVLLIVSQGDDANSKLPISQLANFAASQGVAIFALRDKLEHDTAVSVGLSRDWHTNALPDHPTDALEYLASRNGGLVFNTYTGEIAETLTHFISILHNRYIIEFTAPTQAESGHHRIDVLVPSLEGATVRASGDSAPLPDPAALTDPTTLPSKPSEAVFGKHRPNN